MFRSPKHANRRLNFHHYRPRLSQFDQMGVIGLSICRQTRCTKVIFPSPRFSSPVASINHSSITCRACTSNVEVGEERHEEVTKGVVYFGEAGGFSLWIWTLGEENTVDLTGALKMDGPVVVLGVHHLFS